jgi:hypothetical protein
VEQQQPAFRQSRLNAPPLLAAAERKTLSAAFSFNSGAQLAFILLKFKHFICRSGVTGAVAAGLPAVEDGLNMNCG